MFKNIKNKPIRIVLMVIGGIILAGLFALVFGYFVMLLWNWLMPLLFGLAEISFWQAAGLILLARLLFGNFRHGGSDHHKKLHNGNRNKFEYFFRKKFCDSTDWQHYGDYWEEEGKQAYNEYLERKKTDKPE